MNPLRTVAVAAILTALSPLALPAQTRKSPAARQPTPQGKRRLPPGIIKGTAIHFCSCNAPCPCMFNDGDMEGCNLTAVYHFTDGGYVGRLDKVELKGLTMAVVHRPSGSTKETRLLTKEGKPVDLILYLPTGLTQKQEEALKFILVEHVQATGWANWLVRKATLKFREQKGGFQVDSPGLLHARTEPMIGANGKQLVADHVDFAEGERWLLGRAVEHTYQDPEDKQWKWSFPKSNGAWTRFAWPALDHGE